MRAGPHAVWHCLIDIIDHGPVNMSPVSNYGMHILRALNEVRDLSIFEHNE